MRIIICIILLYFPLMIKADANGVKPLDYKFLLSAFPDPEKVEFELVLKNDGDVPLHFEFPTSQLYEITITDQTGHQVFALSRGRYYLQAFQTISIEPHQTRKWKEKWNYQLNGERVQPGDYNVTAVFKPVKLNNKPIPSRINLTSRINILVPPENTAFRGVKVSGTNGEYVVTGEARSESGIFFYSVEDGHLQFIKERLVHLEAKKGEWEPFTVKVRISKDILPRNGTLILDLYERGLNGKISNIYPAILERF